MMCSTANPRPTSPSATAAFAGSLDPQLLHELCPLTVHELLGLGVHDNFGGPGAGEAFAGPPAGGVDAHLRSVVWQARGVVEGIDRAEGELNVALGIDVVQNF